ncbi:MAG: diguanylate cyclase [Pseudomonadota bacterium]
MHDQQGLKKYTGEFLDKIMEGRYKRSVHTRTLQQVRISLVVVAVLVLVFAAVDFFIVGNPENFFLLLVIRLIISTGCLILAFSLGPNPGLLYRHWPLDLVCFLLVTGSILVVPLRPETIGTQLTAIVAVTLALYLFIPNRIPAIVALSSYMAIGFLYAIYVSSDMPVARIVVIGLAIIVPNVIGYLTTLRLNSLQREQFSSLLSAQETNSLLENEIVARQRLEGELRHLAQTDDLTGLNNRRWFLELSKQALRYTRRMRTPLALCMVDLDRFKVINDTKGHAAGDTVLTLVAEQCRMELRETDIIGRFGGEEFVITFPNANADNAVVIAERLRNRIEDFRLPGDLADLRLTVTVGIAQVDLSETTLEPALLRADKALYTGKREGRNMVVVAEHPPALQTEKTVS